MHAPQLIRKWEKAETLIREFNTRKETEAEDAASIEVSPLRASRDPARAAAALTTPAQTDDGEGIGHLLGLVPRAREQSLTIQRGINQMRSGLSKAIVLHRFRGSHDS